MRIHPLSRLCNCLALVAIAGLLLSNAVNAAKQNSATEGFYNSAVELAGKGDYKGAIIQLKNVLQADPSDLSARILLGTIYLKAEQWSSAAKELLRARRDGARDRFVLPPLGEAYLRHGLYQKVLDEIRAAGQDVETTARIDVVRGEAYLGVQQYEEAEKSFVSALKTLPGNEQALIGMARLKLGFSDFIGAEQYAKWALETNPGSNDAWYLKGEIARQKRDPDNALKYYSRAIELAPQSTIALLGRAGLLISLGRHQEAEPDIIRAREVNPNIPRPPYLHFLILKSRGEDKKAEEALIEADLILQGYPGEVIRSHPPTMLLMGVVSYFRNRDDDAYRRLSRYLELIPYHDGARRTLATIALRRGDTDQALTLLDPIAAYLTKDANFLNLYSDALIQAKRVEDAARSLDAAAKLAAPGSQQMFRVVMLNIAAGRDKRAIELLKAEIAFNPKALHPVLTLAATYMRHKQFQSALNTIDAAIQQYPENPAVHDLAGGAHLGLNDVPAARDSFNRAITANPGYLPAIFNLAKLEGGAGNIAAARRHFSTILEKDPQNGDVMLTLARLHRQENDVEGALRWLDKARTSSRNAKEATLRLINLNLEIGRAGDALLLARQLQLENPTSLLYLRELGRAQISAKKLEVAAATFRQLLSRAQEAKSAPWIRQAAIWLREARDSGTARSALESALRIDEKFVPAHLELFHLDLAADDLDAAMARASLVAKLNPQLATGDAMKGDVFMRRHQFKDAARAYNSAFVKQPNTPLAAKVYQARRAAGQPALSFVVRWTRNRKGDNAALRLLAIAYEQAGQYDDAIKLLEGLLVSDPKDIELLNNAALVYQKMNDQRALDLAKRAHDTAPSQPSIMDTYGWILVKRGQVEQGLRILRNARFRAPDVAAIRYHLAVALDATGNRDEARRELEVAIQLGQQFDGVDDARKLLTELSR